MAKKIVLIGAGSVKFCEGLILDLIAEKGEYELDLVDIDPVALDVADNLARRLAQAYHAPITVQASVDRRDFLSGADVVVSTIGVGSRPAWEKDVFITRQFGIYYPVGDTFGPPGVSRALRMIPQMVDIANDVVAMCPEALFINYSNPMSVVCRAIYKATPAKVVGLCIGVKDVHDGLAKGLEADPDKVWSAAIGVNHFTWFTELRSQGEDAWPLLARKMADRLGPEAQNLCWDLFRAYGAFPAVGDGHVVEFMPGDWQKQGGYYGKTLGLDGPFNFEKDIIERDERVWQRIKDKAYGRVPIDAEDEIGEYSQLVEILRSFWYDEPCYYSVNLPNSGQAGNLPLGSVLEATTLVNGAGFRPLSFGELPPGITALLQRVIGVHELTVEAALKADRGLVIQTLLADGTVFTYQQASKLADALLEAQREWLPNFFD